MTQKFEPLLESSFTFQNDSYIVPEANIVNLVHYLIQKQEKIQIDEASQVFNKLPSIVSLIMRVLTTLIRDCSSIDNYEKFKSLFQSNFSQFLINLSVIKAVGIIISKKLFLCSESAFDYEISYAIIFQGSIFSEFISILAEGQSFLTIKKMTSIMDNISCQSSSQSNAIYLFHLYDGRLFTIDSKSFKKKILQLTIQLGKIFCSEDNLITRNIQDLRNNNNCQQFLQTSVHIACIFKNQTNLKQVIQNITNLIFNSKQYLKKQEFISKVCQFKSEKILWFFIQLIGTEINLLNNYNFKMKVFQNIEKKNYPNFYKIEMQKVLNKCPFNGNNHCNCKKCLCVRRNRQSARLSQSKKRNAIEQIKPLESKIKLLQERNYELEEQNAILKMILNQLKQDSSYNNMLRQAVEPVNKILND